MSYIDQVQMFAVDHPANEEIYTNEKFKGPPYPEFRLYPVARRVYPKAAYDDRGRDVPAGEVGELYARTPMMVSGYHADEAATRASMLDGYFSVNSLRGVTAVPYCSRSTASSTTGRAATCSPPRTSLVRGRRRA